MVRNPFDREKKLIDPAERAARVLDKIILDEEVETSPEPEMKPVQIAETGNERYIKHGERETVRVAMISTDRTIFTLRSPAQERAQELGSVFEEVHIIVLSDREEHIRPLRLAPNVWAYPTNSRSPLLYPYDAYMLAKRQLSFADGFRADVISAENPFGAGLAGYLIARRFKQAFQIEIRLDPFDQSFLDAHSDNRWLSLIASFLIPRADSIRALSSTLRDVISRRYKKIADRIEVLPVFADLSPLKDASPAFDLHTEYPLLKFIVLMVAPLTKGSGVEAGIDACAPLLIRYPTVGLVIVGEGREEAALLKKVIDLNVQNQVIFRGAHPDVLSHLKTANVFLNTAPLERYDDIIAQAAAAGLPIISTDVGFAHELIENGTNGFLCPVGDQPAFSSRLEEFLSNNQMRVTFSKLAQDKILNIIAHNIEGYFDALRYSLEQCVLRHASKDKPPAPSTT